MPKDILNIVFAPKKFSEMTTVDDISTWNDARKKMILYHQKPFLIGNPKLILPPTAYPYKNAPNKNIALRDILCLWWGDITKCKIDAIVNSANIRLKSGGGVCGAIHRCSGHQLYDECLKKYNGQCQVTQCALTNGYKLPSKYVIHAVGPAQIEWDKLAMTYKNVLTLCVKNGIKQICFCCIGCGTHSLPIKQASKVAIYSVIKFLTEKYDPSITEQVEEEQVEEKKNDEVDTSNYNENELKFGYQYFDKVIFNCFTENELLSYRNWLTSLIG